VEVANSLIFNNKLKALDFNRGSALPVLLNAVQTGSTHMILIGKHVKLPSKR
jgi:hypothetical protein